MTFIPNRNFPKELERESKYTKGLAASAKPGETFAKSFAPVRTGAYRDSIGVVIEGGKVYLRATDFKANWIEYGSVNNPPSAPLRRGARAAGLKFKEAGK